MNMSIETWYAINDDVMGGLRSQELLQPTWRYKFQIEAIASAIATEEHGRAIMEIYRLV